MKKLVSVANPASRRLAANSVRWYENEVATLPRNARTLANTTTGKRPMWSAMMPSPRDPSTDPMKNRDCPTAGFQLSSHTQSSCGQQNEERVTWTAGNYISRPGVLNTEFIKARVLVPFLSKVNTLRKSKSVLLRTC